MPRHAHYVPHGVIPAVLLPGNVTSTETFAIPRMRLITKYKVRLWFSSLWTKKVM